MEQFELATLANSWWQALQAVTGGSVFVPAPEILLLDLVEELVSGLEAEPFDAGVGARVGAALASAGFVAPGIPSASAQALFELADRAPTSGRRLAALLAAMGQGYEAHLRAHEEQPAEAAGEATRAADERFRVVFDNAAIAIAIGDTDGTLLDANRGLADMIGVPVDTLRGVSVYDFAHPNDRDGIRTLVYERLVPAGQGTVRLEQRIRRADDSYGWAAFAITFVKGADGHSDYLLAVGEDVTEQHRMREELHRQARHDPLTGLPNRRHLIERIDEMIASAGNGDRAGLCFVDIDRFKHVNDRYGHGTGDQILTAVAARLQDSVRGSGCLIARIGGDEFVALIPPPASDHRVAAVANSLLEALVDPIIAGDRRLRMSISIGAVVTAVAGADAESLLDAADTGLYRAKADGKGRWVLHILDTDTSRQPAL
ncbi:diguanylate cyclase [Nocardia sp. NBC_00508]|uniref:diguanylate cyclase domain-containing protein n=1 Tax=Nocardia sp. NBC_00508 TaxID=2975992 RepID=UPI002E812CAA|nr:diguanylate cyclase [Nocardia sp. NBC_00508]WUD65058.1 diguanylate cyclase [Nocardia sp. NBC_00508]